MSCGPAARQCRDSLSAANRLGENHRASPRGESPSIASGRITANHPAENHRESSRRENHPESPAENHRESPRGESPRIVSSRESPPPRRWADATGVHILRSPLSGAWSLPRSQSLTNVLLLTIGTRATRLCRRIDRGRGVIETGYVASAAAAQRCIPHPEPLST